MNPSVIQIQETVDDFFAWAHDHDFCKTVKLNKMGERYLLPLLKTYFLGRFRDVVPEYSVDGGRIDFIVGNTAIEIVIRKLKSSKNVLVNQQIFLNLKSC